MTDQKNPEVLADEHLDDASGGYKLTNVMVSSYKTNGPGAGDHVSSRGGNSVAIETIELAVEKIERA